MDWSTVAYPPWWNERAALRAEHLDRAVDRVREVVALSPDIVAALIFGSYAQGRIGPESDLDLILVTTLPAHGDAALRTARLAQRLALDIPCDLLVYEPDEFDRLVNERLFLARAKREGIWIDATTPA